jgi:hypothetical protein
MTLALLGAAIAVAAQAHTPPPGSPERKAVLDALRPAIEAKLDPPIEFVVETIEVEQGWAFVQAEPQRRGGGTIDGRRYYSADDWDFMDGLTVTALLRLRDGRWTLVDHAIGATDAWYCGRSPIARIAHC